MLIGEGFCIEKLGQSIESLREWEAIGFFGVEQDLLATCKSIYYVPSFK